MTIDELSQLSDIELSRKCAELCGRREIVADEYMNLPVRPLFALDLNAMHAAEEMIYKGKLGVPSTLGRSGTWVVYTELLGLKDVFPDNRCVHATARQRCIAFIAALSIESRPTTK